MKLLRRVRDIYQLEEIDRLRFNSIHQVRLFVQKVNQRKDLINYPELAVRASTINAIGLLHELYNHTIDQFRREVNPNLIEDTQKWLEERIDEETLNKTLALFLDEFPPSSVYQNEVDVNTYLDDETNGISNRLMTIEEITNLWLGNSNPAFSPRLEFFDDADLEKKSAYSKIVNEINSFLSTQPTFGSDNQHLNEMLQSPAQHAPHSLAKQLEYIRKNWPISNEFLFRILTALDLIKEEEKMRLLGSGESLVYEYVDEGEYYTPDRDWMPKVVMIAKNVYVWLDQLSKSLKKPISKLNEIPDEELDKLARWGFNSIWIIGLWERSSASKTVKHWCGNPEAEASAYSLYDYIIAPDLGGLEAYQNLKDRAWRRGIRIATDMVPNHTGIDSKWMTEHPDWFISLPHSPFPAYSYSGQSLSKNPEVGIYLEDHYFTRTDAAVTFKYYNFATGETKFIYHGNDGTSMPWNDTAQLNYLKPEVREAVIQKILQVAKNSSIIRFDAAMTLTRKHYQRLWFPEPGSGGDIPSRAGNGLSKSDFYKAMPQEFWREVVDRINQEAPDTLLLAEAFWLLEGFFVRTLGMHRVYNSAFMNMLRDEDNSKYRLTIKNTLEFDPEILKRFVNFMNNPDEETAVNQFGKGDKYFGICVMLATMPGLPMFGHGQIEGFSEKYGMEYRKAYWDEEVDITFVQHHERVIFPLMKKRYLYAEVKNFLLYDFWSGNTVNEDVFAYSNRSGNENTLVIYHNKFGDAKGFIKMSAAFAIKKNGDEKELKQKSLADGLALPSDGYCIFKDYVSGMEFIRDNKEIHEKGLYIELHAYQYIVYNDFREIQDNEWQHYAQLHDFLAGRGVNNIDELLQQLIFRHLQDPFKKLVNPATFKEIREGIMTKEIHTKLVNLLREVKKYSSSDMDESQIIKEILNGLTIINRLSEEWETQNLFSNYLKDELLPITPFDYGIIISWLLVKNLGKVVDMDNYELRSRSWIDEWLFGRTIEQTLQELSKNKRENVIKAVLLIKILTSHQNWIESAADAIIEKKPFAILRGLLSDLEVQRFLQINRYQNVLWYSKEALEEFLRWISIFSIVESLAEAESKEEEFEHLNNKFQMINIWRTAAEKSGCQVELLLKEVNYHDLKEVEPNESSDPRPESD